MLSPLLILSDIEQENVYDIVRIMSEEDVPKPKVNDVGTNKTTFV